MLLHNIQTLVHYRLQNNKDLLGLVTSDSCIDLLLKAQLTATIDNWGPYYVRKVGQVLEGTWKPECDPVEGCYFGHMNDGSCWNGKKSP